MLEIRILIDELDYASVVDMAVPIACEKLKSKGGFLGKVATKEDKIKLKAYHFLNGKTQDKRDKLVSDVACKFKYKINDVVNGLATKKGIRVKNIDISVNKL